MPISRRVHVSTAKVEIVITTGKRENESLKSPSACCYSEGENSDEYWQDGMKQQKRAGIFATAEELA